MLHLSMSHLTSAMPMVNAIGMWDGDATKSGNGMTGLANGIINLTTVASSCILYV